MEVVRTPFGKAMGLMFRREGEMLFVFNRDVRFSVWTPFMRFTLDVFFLDKDFNIVGSKRDFRPWKFCKPRYAYRYFFESVAGKYSEKKVRFMVEKALN